MQIRYTALSWMMLASMLTAIAAPEDVTSKYIKNASFESGSTWWTVSGMKQQSNDDFAQKAGYIYYEKWTGKGSKVGDGTVMQKLSELPAGQYQLKAGAQNIQQGSSVAQSGAVIFAGSAETKVTALGEYSVDFSCLGEDVEIGFRAIGATGNWIAVDNFRLYYMGLDSSSMLAEISSRISNAEALLAKPMQNEVKNALEAAIATAKSLTAESSADDFSAAAKALASAQKAAETNIGAVAALQGLISEATPLLSRPMSDALKVELQAATDAAQAIVDNSSDEDIASATTRLTKAIAAAKEGSESYTTLETAITTAESVYDESKTDADVLLEAINAAKAILNNSASTSEQFEAAAKTLDDAVLAFRIANATGTKPTVKMGSFIQGSTIIFARGTFSSAGKERGFCYSTTNPEPDVFDERATTRHANNGDIFFIDNLKPGTLYYIRPYGIGAGYKVSYGAVVKVYTLPKAGVTYSYDYAGDQATNDRIVSAVEDAVNVINSTTQIKNFHLNVHYVPGAGAGDGTADCSYGGWMRIAQNTSYQRTGTVLHEGGHGMGVGTTNEWYNNSNYRENTSRGLWLGERVDRVMDFLANATGQHLTGDNTHMWPYGINGAHEDDGSRILYHANAMIHEALGEDGLIISGSNFIQPAWTFMHDEETKYYLKNENENFGLQSSYLCEAPNNRLKWLPMTAEDALSNDSCAWYFHFDPATCLYTITNAATGKTMVKSGTGNNGIRLSASPTSSNSRFQLLGGRSFASTKSGYTTYTFTTKGYWFLSSDHYALTGAAASGTSATSFNHSNASSQQRWIILTDSEVTKFGKRIGDKVVGIEQVAATPQSEDNLNVVGGQGAIAITALNEGQDVAVYNLDGRLMRQLYVQMGATARVPLPRGVYLVGGQKVAVR